MTNATSLTANQQSAMRGAGQSHHNLIEAQHKLYRVLGEPQPGREKEWAANVAQELLQVQHLLSTHREGVQGPGGLYEELRLDAQWLIPRLQQLVAQLARLENEVADLRVEALRVAEGDVQGLGSIRHDAERVLASVRDLLSKESDIVFERFNEPVALD